MFARQQRRQKRQRFQVDPALPPQRKLDFSGAGAAQKRPKRRFHVELPESSASRLPRGQRLPPFALVRTRHRPRLRFNATLTRLTRLRALMGLTTLDQRRLLHRWALLLMLLCVAFIATVGSTRFFASRAQPFVQTVLHTKTAAPSSAHSSAVGAASQLETPGEQTQHNLLTRPFGSLELHFAANGSHPPAVEAAAAYLFDPNSDLVFYEKHADEERPIASLTKLMTLVLASEAGNLNQLVTIGPDAAALVNGANSYMGVSAGEQLTISDLLYGLVVASGNDAAEALADAVGGNEATFVGIMNRRAWQLGLTKTQFVTPDGLDDGNRSTARDLAVLTAVALEQPGFEQITSTRHYTIAQTATHKAYELWSGNDLLLGGRSPYPGATGVKTGYTNGALYCFAFSARRDGHLLVGVVLGDPTAKARMSDAHALLDWGFKQE
jgi:serine-type D-Ala-D-Ala carboxypeptidase (penicillin-binding protein 5/6)